MTTGSHPEGQPAARFRKPSWKDPRLIVGALLVLSSIAGVSVLVSAADRTTAVYSAREDLNVGTRLTPQNLVAVRVRLGELDPSYLPVDEGLPKDAVVTTLVRAGELVPRGALDGLDPQGRKPVGLQVEEPLPKHTAIGSRVDVWVAEPDGQNGYNAPELLLEAAEVAEISRVQSALGSSSSTRLHVLVPEDKMSNLLSALANEAKIAVVDNSGGARP